MLLELSDGFVLQPAVPLKCSNTSESDHRSYEVTKAVTNKAQKKL